jgi:hypothetical protein
MVATCPAGAEFRKELLENSYPTEEMVADALLATAGTTAAL